MKLASEAFFDKIKKQHKEQKPFVIYNKPNINKISGLLQLTNDVFYTEKYTKEGFVFVPFSNSEKSILIPRENSQAMECGHNFSNEEQQLDGVLLKKESLKEKKHMALVENAVSTIKQTALQKVVLSRTKEIELPTFNFILVFKKLVQKYPNAFCYVWYHPEIGLWLGATPEVLLVAEDRAFKTMALAGTQKYNGKMDVEWGDKEKTEQELVTESILENLKKICPKIEVSEVKTIKAGPLLHLKTDIRGKANTGNIGDIVACLHPTPAVCGLPTELAKDFILKEEGYNRAYYTGFLGELNFKEDTKKITSLFVNLRCMQYTEGKLIIYVGGGITKDSDAQLEWLETENKSRTMLDALLK
ncbi:MULTISPECIES: isochorismate synthase [Galbibacter]|uniref:isochorismate synthase n=1 Tax=Galbibacter pacificus TaxID=2996052 RepID=A0ABT6FQL0_9FLAO|nr:isochorismate synthase [Galbibacter pacificus]MDG3581968.1 isochorismate synthase [Galbibacter pacificus]MDG3585558.1 isochorismate synthase [Galbibacter pacificus]